VPLEQVPLEQLESQDLLVPLVRQDLPVQQDHKDHKDPEDHKVPLAQVQQDLLDLLVPQVLDTLYNHPALWTWPVRW
jgi:hypothetical protein